MKKVIIFILLIIITNVVTHTLAKKEQIIIYLDPGHGGKDNGAHYEDIYEDEIVLDITERVSLLFNNIGIKTIQTRYTDTDLGYGTNRKRTDIHKRVSLINSSNADIYISLHLNSMSNSLWSGAQTFYTNINENNKLLSEEIQSNLINNTNTTRKAMTIKEKYLIDNTNITGCLVEAGFLSNKEERELLITDDYKDILANSIYLGVLSYLQKITN